MKKITQEVFFRRDDLNIFESPYGMKFHMQGCSLSNEVGAPELPVAKIKIAVPSKMRAESLKVKVLKKSNITHQKTFVANVQEKPDPFNSETEEAPFNFVKPDPELYQNAIEKDDIAIIAGNSVLGNMTIAIIEFKPVQYEKDGILCFIEHASIECSVTEDSSIALKPALTKAQRYQEHSMVHDLVLNSKLVEKSPLGIKEAEKAIDPLIKKYLDDMVNIPEHFNFEDLLFSVPGEVDYLIITDNNQWDKDTITTTGAAGDLVAEFERLADHKKERGYRTHIAQISHIVAGLYGDFKTGANDLQEVIRNFLKNFCYSKGVEWVLLGGDICIIPTRLVCGCAWGRVGKGDIAETNRSEWTGTYLKMNVDQGKLGATTHFLTNYDTGKLIPFDSTGNAATGWYHTTNNSFNTFSAARTQWIRVNGNAATADATMAWYTPGNMIPTDLYYSSLYSSYYNTPGKHDWDLLDNGLYGQHSHDNQNLDGLDFTVDVSLGRAPVETVPEAESFVNKIITYDKWGDDHLIADYNRFKKMLLVSEHFARHFSTIKPDTGNSNPPANNRFYTDNANDRALIHCTNLTRENPGDRIIVHFSDESRKILNFNLDADTNNHGWYYANSANDLNPSFYLWELWFFSIRIPVPTDWVVVYGTNSEISPMQYSLDKEGTDSTITRNEELREWMKSNFYRVNQVQRLYTDITDMPAGSLDGSGLKYLTADNLKEELDKGPHLISISGHGSSGGVAHLNKALVDGLNNGDETFIVYADSCSTNKFDVNDALGEYAVMKANKGAVAYIGYSRYGWIGTGADFRELFFKTMKYTRNIGKLNDSRCQLRNESNGRLYKLWTILVQNLMGDPEMNVYRDDYDAYPKYIGNKRTKELHRSTCQWVKLMASWNMRYYDSIEEGINLGYDGCYYCLRAYDHG